MPAFFHNRLLMLVLMLGMGLGFASAVYAETEPAKAEVLNPQQDQVDALPAALNKIAPAPVRVELLEKLQDKLTELDKETAVLKAELGTRIDAQDNRIADGIGLHGADVTKLSNQTSMLGLEVAVLGVLIAVVTIFAAIAGYFSFSQATKNAVAAAKVEAIEESGKWFRENERELTDRISALSQQVEDVQKHAAETKSRMEQAGQDVGDHAAEVHQRLEQAEAAIVKREKPSFEVVKQVTQDAHDLNLKPRTEWTVDDFYNAGVYSYTSGDYEVALTRWNTVISMLNDSPDSSLHEQMAKTLINKGVTLGDLEQFDDAVSAYDVVISRFNGKTDSGFRKLVAKALVNKGATLGLSSRFELAIEVCEEVIDRFDEPTEPELCLLWARAAFIRGMTQGLMKRAVDARSSFEELIIRFGDSTEPELREIVEKARSKLDGKP